MSGNDHERHMREAMEEARNGAAAGNLPIGSVIVRDGAVIGTGCNRVNADADPTAHAETVAIRDACRRLGTTDLSGSVLYTTMEPCPMCLWAMRTAGVATLVMGARLASFHRPEYGRYRAEALIDMTDAPLEVVTGVLERECVHQRTELDPGKR